MISALKNLGNSHHTSVVGGQVEERNKWRFTIFIQNLQTKWDIGTLELDTVQDFLMKLGIKPCMHLLEIGIFSLYYVIIRPTKIMNRADKNWAQF